MPLTFNGTNITGADFNGTGLTQIVYNGQTIFQDPFYVYYGFVGGTRGSRYNGALTSLINSSTSFSFTRVRWLEADSSNVYTLITPGTTDSRLIKWSRNLQSLVASSTAVTFTNNQWSFTMDDTMIYVTNAGTSIRSYNKSTFAAGTNRTFSGVIYQLLNDNNYIFAVSGGTFIRITKPFAAGSAVLSRTVFASGVAQNSNAMAQDAEFLYAITLNGAFVKIRKSDMVIVLQIPTTMNIPQNAGQIAVDNNHVYSINSLSSNGPKRCNLDGTNVISSQYSFSVGNPHSIRLSGSNIYVGTENPNIVIFSKNNFNVGTNFAVQTASSTFSTPLIIRGLFLDSNPS